MTEVYRFDNIQCRVRVVEVLGGFPGMIRGPSVRPAIEKHESRRTLATESLSKRVKLLFFASRRVQEVKH
jgi:hypothetical protein